MFEVGKSLSHRPLLTQTLKNCPTNANHREEVVDQIVVVRRSGDWSKTQRTWIGKLSKLRRGAGQQRSGTACQRFQNSNCRYTQLIGLCFPHCGIASLAQVSTMGLCLLLENHFTLFLGVFTHSLTKTKASSAEVMKEDVPYVMTVKQTAWERKRSTPKTNVWTSPSSCPEYCRYTWLIRSCFPHCGIASLAQAIHNGPVPSACEINASRRNIWNLIEGLTCSLKLCLEFPINASGRKHI